MSKIPKWLKITGAVLIGLIIIGAIASSGEQTKTENSKQEQTSQPTETEKPVEQANRCLEVPEAVVASLNEGFNTEGLILRNAKAVKSSDFESVYFISADIQGAGLEGEDDIATFTTNSLESGGGIYMSVDRVAKQFSVFPDASNTDAKATMSDDGAEQSRDCVNG